MTTQDIIKQTETFTIDQKQQLAYYFFFATISEDKKQDFMHLFHYKNDFEEVKENKRKLGLWENKISNISSDFNEPLEELSDYM